MNVSAMFGKPETYEADVFLKDGQAFTLAGFEIVTLHTPGHTPGGACYYFKDQKVLVSGDFPVLRVCGEDGFPGRQHVQPGAQPERKGDGASQRYAGCCPDI